ncbi:Protein of unknown function [Propionibacterium freudenreichii subsp. freudenreichii]|nr:Hypothetical protein PFREUD_22390 [Propionibacterium freudenreichii subsp. shermanii CIRM-BIA1]CEG96730.1 Protein of unknown function [Propionibacterium freudenreichii]CEH02525.1 Protein of unknown function [Propionibacterium freudenreichii]CEI30869.1 Protein of unknown function [Propionibacterium freudenreichii]CEP27654.1 Protein of unknown function [Propionibacterium freudenreichii subsp. freudenreichii]
MIGELHV